MASAMAPFFIVPFCRLIQWLKISAPSSVFAASSSIFTLPVAKWGLPVNFLPLPVEV
jgi:hypothetical protein